MYFSIFADPPQSFFERLHSSPTSQDLNELPPTMCTDRLPGTYCPFGDPSECDCLELFTSHVTSLSDIQEDPAYIEELLDELSSSLSEISDVDLYTSNTMDPSTATGNDSDMVSSNVNDSSLVTSDMQARFSHSLHLTSTPVHRRNPVLSSVVSPVFDENSPITVTEEGVFGKNEDQTQSQGMFDKNKDTTISGKNCVFRKCELDDSLELFGMAKLGEVDSVDVIDDEQKGVYGETWWGLEGPYIYNMNCDVSQLVLPNSRQVEDSMTLFF